METEARTTGIARILHEYDSIILIFRVREKHPGNGILSGREHLGQDSSGRNGDRQLSADGQLLRLIEAPLWLVQWAGSVVFYRGRVPTLFEDRFWCDCVYPRSHRRRVQNHVPDYHQEFGHQEQERVAFVYYVICLFQRAMHSTLPFRSGLSIMEVEDA